MVTLTEPPEAMWNRRPACVETATARFVWDRPTAFAEEFASASTRQRGRGPRSTSLRAGPRHPGASICFVHGFSAYDRAQNSGAENFLSRYSGEVTVKDDEIGEHAGGEGSLLFLAKFGVGSASRVGRNRLFDGELLCRMVFLPAIFALASDGCVDTAKRV